jgi:hypothetical protein
MYNNYNKLLESTPTLNQAENNDNSSVFTSICEINFNNKYCLYVNKNVDLQETKLSIDLISIDLKYSKKNSKSQLKSCPNHNKYLIYF